MQQSRTVRFSQRLNELSSKLSELAALRVQVEEAERRARAARRRLSRPVILAAHARPAPTARGFFVPS